MAKTQELGPLEHIFESRADLITRKPARLANGAFYIGQWNARKNQREGHGIIYFADGSIFEGEMKKNKANGFGRHIRHDGEVYIGMWYNDMVHGKGTLINSAGESYDGEWLND